MLCFNEKTGQLYFTPVIAAKKLPRRVSSKGNYWKGFRDGAQEIWTDKEIQLYYERMGQR